MNATAVQQEWVGRVIDGRFTLLQWLGGSGRSGVFLTELPGEPPRKAAIKLIPAEQEDAATLVVGWAAATHLSHPHLVRLFGTGRCALDGAELIYTVTEYADEVLAEILPVRPLTPEEAREMLGPVAEALAYLHGEGFVHSRLKPSNLLVVDDQLKLSADNLQAAGAAGNAVPPLTIYDAPERAQGDVTPATDVWSLGITLVEALTQAPPDWDRSAGGDPVIPKSIPHPLSEIVRGCLQIDPARRWTLGEIGGCLNPVAPQIHAIRGVESKATGRPRISVVVVATLVLIAAIALLWMHYHEPQQPTADDQQRQASAPAEPQAESQAKPSPAVAASPREQPPAVSTAPAPMAPADSASHGATLKGVVAQRVEPEVLPAATYSIQGAVNVRVRVNVGPRGEVSNATVESSGPSHYFAKAAVDAAQQWKFKPAQVNGTPVASVWLLQFEFTRGATAITPVEETP